MMAKCINDSSFRNWFSCKTSILFKIDELYVIILTDTGTDIKLKLYTCSLALSKQISILKQNFNFQY